MVVWPEYISLNYWAATLVDNYSDYPLPILDDDKKWEDWGAAVAGTAPFSHKGIPVPFSTSEGVRKSHFKKWEDWAKIVYINML